MDIGRRDVRNGRSADTFRVRANYKTLNKITLESHGSVRARTGVSTCTTEDGDDVDVVTRGRKGRRRGRNVPVTRCRHVAEERDGACLFKPILYRIFILMDFFNSGRDGRGRVGPRSRRRSVSRVSVLWPVASALEDVEPTPGASRG